MNNNALNAVQQIYSAVAAPVCAADDKLNILWKNSAADACGFFNCAVIDFLQNKDGMQSVLLNGDYHLFNVIRPAAEFLVVEYIGRDNSRNISHMKDYFIFLCTRLRESASQISMAADDIDLLVKTGSNDIAAVLNRIDKNVNLLLKEALVPETVFYVSDPYCKDESVNLAHALAVSVSDAEQVFGRRSEIWQNSVDNVCAKINNSVLETIFALMTAEACCGERYPERIEFSVERDDDAETRGFVSIRSICLSDKKNPLFSLEFLKKNEFFTFAALKGTLAERYGISFETVQHSDGTECIMRLDVLPEQFGIVMTDKKASLRQERFTPMAAALSEKHCGEHYKNIKMN